MILYHIWVIVYGKNLYIVAQLIETKWLNIIHKTEGLKKQSMVKINHLPKEIHCSIDHGQKHHAKNWTLILAEPSKHHQLILFPKKSQPDHGQDPDLYSIDFQTLGHGDVSRSPAGCLGERKHLPRLILFTTTQKVGEIDMIYGKYIQYLFKCR